MGRENNKKISKKARIWLISGSAVIALTAVLLVLFLVILPMLPLGTDGSGRYIKLNALPEKLNSMAVLKDGDLYLCRDGKAELVAEDLYDPSGEESYGAVSYIWNQNTDEMMYIADASGESVLMYFDGKESKFIARNVSAWRASADMKKIAFVIGASGSTKAGKLMLYEMGGQSSLLDSDVIATSIYFSQDGSRLFASVNNGKSASLMCYEGAEGRELLQGTGALVWLDENGKNFAYAELEKSGQYQYTLYNEKGASKQFREVSYMAGAADSSVLYLLADYDNDAKSGTLYAVNPDTLRAKKLASNVAYMNTTAVNDVSKGIVYASNTSTADRYDISYAGIDGTKLNLIRKTHIKSLNTVCLNTVKQKGYIILQGNTVESNQLYAISWENNKLNVTEIDSGSIYEVIYYEACDSALYSKDGSENHTALYKAEAFQGSSYELGSVGAVYDSSYGTYYSCSLLSNDGRYILYFKDIVVLSDAPADPYAKHPTAAMHGTLMLYDTQTQAYKMLAKNVKADTFNDIKANGSADHIYFSVLNQKNYDICFYDGTDVQVILEGADVLLDYIVE